MTGIRTRKGPSVSEILGKKSGRKRGRKPGIKKKAEPKAEQKTLNTMDDETLVPDNLRQKLNRTMARCRGLESQVVALQQEISSMKANQTLAIQPVSICI